MLGLMQGRPLLISNLVDYAANWHGDREIISRDPAGAFHRSTYAEIAARAKQVAGVLDALGAGPGDRVATLAWNSYRHLEIYYGVTCSGRVLHTVNPRLFPEQLQYIMHHAEDVFVFFDPTFTPLVEQLAPHLPHVRGWIALCDAQNMPKVRVDRLLCYEDLLASASGNYEWPQFDENSASTLCYTSGTTGNPKGVRRVLDAQSAAAMSRLASDVFNMSPGQKMRTVVTGPVYHSAPNFFALTAVRDGGLAILQPRFAEEELLQLIDQYKITHVHMVPTMFVRLLRLPDEVKRKYDLSSLTTVIHGAAPCPADVKQKMIEWWGPVIVEYYGATETGAIVLNNSEEALRKPGTVGRALDGATIRILDDAGNLLGANEVGEIYIWMEGFPDFTYHNNPQKRAACEREGLVSVGDVGYLDNDGFLFLCDRKNDMVIMGGSNVYPQEIEAALLAMPGVQDCAVFGIPDDDLGEKLAAYVQPIEGASIGGDDVKAYLRQRLANYKVPSHVKLVDTLPREDSGKIMKRKLREPYWAGVGRRI